jgi:hypothetical protein
VSQPLYLDENFIDQVHIEVLRSGGYDVLDAGAAGMLRRSDRDQLAFATDHRRLLVTYDRKDYHALHGDLMNRVEPRHGILLVFRDADYGPGELLRRIDAMFEFLGRGTTANQLLFLSNFGND